VAAEFLIVTLLCAYSGYAIWKGTSWERLAGAIFACGIVVFQSRNLPYAFLLCTCCGYAMLRGGAPERISAAITAYAVILTYYATNWGPGRFATVEVGILVVDVVALAAWAAVAVYAQRFWPIWLTALDVIAVAGHGVKMADPDLRWGYAFAIAFWSYPMLLVLAGGTWCHRRRLARHGYDPDWSANLPRLKFGRAPESAA
jgi:hypothetical protein